MQSVRCVQLRQLSLAILVCADSHQWQAWQSPITKMDPWCRQPGGCGEVAMKTSTVRLGLSLMIVLGFWSNGALAQEVFVVPSIPYEPARHGPPTYPFAQRAHPAPADHWLLRAANNHGVGCKTDPYIPACTDFHHTMRFAFSSCRYFFDQKCEPNQFCGDKHRLRR